MHFPVPTYVRHLELASATTVPLFELCERAGVTCRATGRWVERRIEVVVDGSIGIEAEPGGWGAVCIHAPMGDATQTARYALAALAYGLMDGVARESIKGQSWARPSPPSGRPRSGRARTPAQRQRKFVARAGEPQQGVGG